MVRVGSERQRPRYSELQEWDDLQRVAAVEHCRLRRTIPPVANRASSLLIQWNAPHFHVGEAVGNKVGAFFFARYFWTRSRVCVLRRSASTTLADF